MQITYQPRFEGDPAFTKLKGGIVLRAGEPREVTDPEVCKWAPKNPWFKCEGAGVDAAEQAAKIANGPRSGGWDMRVKPKSAEDYRAYAIAKINKAMPDPTAEDHELAAKQCVDGLKKWWADEEDMRLALGVGEDDLDKINGIFEPKLAQLLGG